MIKKRLSIILFIIIIVSSVGLFLKFSKIETPKQHADNAEKITQIAGNGEAVKKSASPSSENKIGNDGKSSSNAANSGKNTNSGAASSVQTNSSSQPGNTQGTSSSSSNSSSKSESTKSAASNSSSQVNTQGVSPKSIDYNKLVSDANEHKNSGKKDKYLTDPTPEGMPTPVEPQNVKVNKSTAGYCTLSIRCDTILKNKNKLRKSKLSVLPGDGVIYSERQAVFYKGESVFDVLVRETARNNIQMDFVNTPIYNSAYIRGIHNLYEFDCKSLSGWMYKVNGWFPNYGCSRYQVKPGDKIEWVYTCDLGRDVGCTWISETK